MDSFVTMWMKKVSKAADLACFENLKCVNLYKQI